MYTFRPGCAHCVVLAGDLQGIRFLTMNASYRAGCWLAGLLARPAAALPMSTTTPVSAAPEKRKATEEVPDEGPPTPSSDEAECSPIVEAEVDPHDPEVLEIKTVRPRKRLRGRRRVFMTVEDEDSGDDETEPEEPEVPEVPKGLPKEPEGLPKALPKEPPLVRAAREGDLATVKLLVVAAAATPDER